MQFKTEKEMSSSRKYFDFSPL